MFLNEEEKENQELFLFVSTCSLFLCYIMDKHSISFPVDEEKPGQLVACRVINFGFKSKSDPPLTSSNVYG